MAVGLRKQGAPADGGRRPIDGVGVSQEAAKVALELVRSRLDRQGVRLAEIRTNSSVLLATTALIASFLGKSSIDQNGLSEANWVAIAFLVAGVLLGIRPLWPVRDPSGTSIPTKVLCAVPLFGKRLVKLFGGDSLWFGAPPVYEVAALDAQPNVETRLAVANSLEANVEANQKILNRRSRWVIHTSLCLFGQVVAWTLALAA
jgi:hypothetical protein